MKQETVNRIASVIADDQHHDGANLMRRALVSIFYRGPKWNFPLGELWRFDPDNLALFQEIIDHSVVNRHHELIEFAEQAKAYLVKHKEV